MGNGVVIAVGVGGTGVALGRAGVRVGAICVRLDGTGVEAGVACVGLDGTGVEAGAHPLNRTVSDADARRAVPILCFMPLSPFD